MSTSFPDSLLKKKNVLFAIKIFVCILAGVAILVGFFAGGFDNYTDSVYYDLLNSPAVENSEEVYLTNGVRQMFVSKSGDLSNINLLIWHVYDINDKLVVSIKDLSNTTLCSKEFSVVDLKSGQWCSLGIDAKNLQRSAEYVVEIITVSGRDTVTVLIDKSSQNADPVFSNCYVGSTLFNGTLAIDIRQTFTYMTITQVFHLIVDVFSALVLIAVVAFSLFNIEKLISCAKKQMKKGCFIYAFYSATLFFVLFNPINFENTELRDFVRIIGMGISNGTDVERIISNFTVWFMSFVILFSLFLLFYNFIKQRDYSEREMTAWKFLDVFTVVCVACQILWISSFFLNTDTGVRFNYSSALLNLVFLAVAVYAISGISKKVSFSYFIILTLFSLSTSYPIAIFTRGKWESGLLLFCVQAIIITIMLVVLMLLKEDGKIINSKKTKTIICCASISASLFPLFLSWFLEIVNIVVGRGIFIVNIFGYYLISVLAVLLVFAVLLLISAKTNLVSFDARKVIYPIFILGVVSLSYQIPYHLNINTDLFESANAGILISDLLNFNSIPIVEHYGGHMLTGVIEGIIYGIINNDAVGATFSPYASMLTPLICVFLFFILKELIGEDIAFWFTILIPTIGIWALFGVGFIIVAGVVYYIKKPSYFRAALVWVGCIFCTLMRLDIGFSFDFAALFALAVYVIVSRNTKAVKQLSLTLLGAVGAVGFTWIILCLVKGINPINRLLEFIKIGMSNQNWAYGSMGNTASVSFAICYIFVPLFVAISLLYLVLSKKTREKMASTRWIVLLVLGFAYFTNFSRGIVRHSLWEYSYPFVLWTAMIYTAIFISSFFKPQSLIYTTVATLMVYFVLVGGYSFTETSFMDKSSANITGMMDSWSLSTVEKEDGKQTFWQTLYNENINKQNSGNDTQGLANQKPGSSRITLDDSFWNNISPLSEIVNTLLENDETYIDLMNRTITFSVLGRKNPVYVSQSPLQLSGEYTQQCFVNQMIASQDYAPIVIFPTGNNFNDIMHELDSVANKTRYYLVFEHVYQNYTPLCILDKYEVWCLNSRHEELSEKAKTNSNLSIISYSSFPVEYYGLKKLPLVWGELDSNNAKESEQLASIDNLGNGFYEIQNISSVDKSSGNYLYIATDYYGQDVEGFGGDNDEFIEIGLWLGNMENGEFVKKCYYSFYVMEGRHDYIIRLSMDHTWYAYNCDTIKIESPCSIYNVNMSILRGN